VNARWQESFKDIIRHITDREGNLLSYREVWHHD